MGLFYSPLWKSCRAEEETSDHVLCMCEALASLRHTYLHSFSLDPVDVWRQSRTLLKEQGSHELDIRLWGTNGVSKRPACIRTHRAETHLLFYTCSYLWLLIKLCYTAVVELGMLLKPIFYSIHCTVIHDQWLNSATQQLLNSECCSNPFSILYTVLLFMIND